MAKISVIGAGNVGATTVQRLAELELGEIVMTDIVEGLPQGKALDLMQAGAINDYDTQVTGTNDYADIADSDLVIITAGIARKPGMSREDLIKTNSKIIGEVSRNIAEYSPNSIVINVTNPLDIITYVAMKATGFEPKKVFGMSGVLDTGRFASFIAEELKCSKKDVEAMVIGGHGDLMVPLPQYTTISGVPLPELLPDETIARLVERTVNGGAEIVGLLKQGSAFYAPSAAIVRMAEAVLKDSKRILPASAYLEGQYGQEGIYFGVPVKLGANGIEEILELELDESQSEILRKSSETIRRGISQLDI
ncbi:malate dehydrogenase [Methanosarcina sp. 2.H.T.1A.6]|uniref:malate dehydrogenase n=1 Tax=unclassified Methanosarcina TaxID=2644672 RepID=UPI00062285D7|nr:MULTISPECIES: malate dehydrogenase [unclassified Methanosarcina]KKG13550.1 malate dehydrogenase [Methanosarcina sp. 2.H.T.1A.3]KKG13952.1 malate dehydrogenase [Methanosarcina sp. 2.H.T.1A.15]KKG24842.1 malate dehydrogenase [Methanosarcina sp. 2.H.T.1A.6]KKG26040.1 malate dehydrogenase [Methanosarcina sp. 2.H.T.1A.8]